VLGCTRLANKPRIIAGTGFIAPAQPTGPEALFRFGGLETTK